jgi:hypothetical protein
MARWAIIGDIGDEFTERAYSMLRKWGPYRTRKKDGKISFALSFSHRGTDPLIQLSPWMSKHNIDQFSLRKFKTSKAISAMDTNAIAPEGYKIAQKAISERTGINRLEIYRRVVFYSSLEQQEYSIKKIVAKDIFEVFPDCEMRFVIASPKLNAALAALRVIGAGRDLIGNNIEFENLLPIKLMIDSQNAGIFYSGKYLTVPIAIFLPRLYGFVASKVVLSYLFIFNTPISDVRTYFPRSGLELLRSETIALFGQNIDVDISEFTPEIADSFCIIDKKFSKIEILEFVNQYIQKLNSFIYFLIDPSNFTLSGSDRWGALSQYQAWLCIERLADEIILMLTDDTPYLRKVALFRVLDQLASLTSKDIPKQVRTFKNFLLPQGEIDIISSGLLEYSGTVAKYVLSLLDAMRENILQTGTNSIYVTERINKNKGTVTLLTNEEISLRNFVVEMVRELRNTYHGYYTKRFKDYLAISSGDTPDNIPGIGFLAFFALIARPDLFIRREL